MTPNHYQNCVQAGISHHCKHTTSNLNGHQGTSSAIFCGGPCFPVVCRPTLSHQHTILLRHSDRHGNHKRECDGHGELLPHTHPHAIVDPQPHPDEQADRCCALGYWPESPFCKTFTRFPLSFNLCRYLCAYAHMNACTHTHMHICMFVHAHMNVYMCMIDIGTCIYRCVCVYVCLCVNDAPLDPCGW